uniref:Uncharacterized protein n=1 Tax=Brassica oleracea var. oleracea TaxID=109376 RepID=A0A0D3CRP9_BRAOL
MFQTMRLLCMKSLGECSQLILHSSSKKNQIKRSSYLTVIRFTNHAIFSSREFRPPEKLEMTYLLSDKPMTNSIIPKKNTSCFLLSFLQANILYFVGLVRHIKKRLEALLLLDLVYQVVSEPLNRDKMFGLLMKRKANPKKTHKMPNRRCKEQFKTSRDEVAEPSIFISEEPKGKSENNLEDLKDFSDSLPIFDEYDEELIESLIICEDECDLPSPKSDFMFDDEETNGLTCFEPEHPSSLVLFSQRIFRKSHSTTQGPLLGTRRPIDDDLGPIFDEEDEPGPTIEAEAPSVTSIIMENQLCFDPDTTPTPLSTDIQEHCDKIDLINSLPEIFVKISSEDVKRFGFDKVKEFRVSNSIFGNMQGFDHLEKSFELGLQQPVLCARKSFDSFVFKENGFNLSSYRHALITGSLFASTCVLDEFMVKTLLEQKSPRVKSDFCDSVLKLDIMCVETDKLSHILRSLLENCVVLSFDVILLKRVLHVLGKETLISDLNKYISCTYDPRILMDGAAHGCRRDDHISSQRPRKLDDRISSNQVYDDSEERLLSALQAVEESYIRSTRIPILKIGSSEPKVNSL